MRLFYLFKKFFKYFFSFRRKPISRKISQINFDKKDLENNIDFVNKTIKQKNKKQKFRIFASASLIAFLILFLLFSPGYIFNKSNYQVDISNLLLNKNNAQTVLTLWHIETFEGGSASRTKYLEKQAIAFNKKQKDCFIVVKTLNENQLFLNLEKKNYPDMFSFGIGTGYMVLPFLTELKKYENIRQDLQIYGENNGKLYAYPYMMGGYLTITREKDYSNNNIENFTSIISKKNKKLGFGVSTGEFTNSLNSLNLDLLHVLDKNCMYEAENSYDAYVAFVQNKFKTLIGTTRDLARCKNRELNGSLDSCIYTYLSGYTDLVQYIGVNKNLCSSKLKLANDFSKFLLGEISQKSISNYGLFGVTLNKIYNSDYYSDFEDVLMEKLSSINVFSSLEEIENKKQVIINKI